MYSKLLAEKGQVKTLPFSFTGTSVTLGAAVSGKQLRLISLVVITDTASTVNVQDNTGTPVELVGPLPVAANGGFVLPPNALGWGDTGSGKQLDLVLGTSGTCGGVVQYQILSTE